ncbi:glyoxylate/hydroxypyruvate reductase A [Rhizobium sp. Root149]|uniref:2-hydroxyacid dehydrogenase n=1 Tax=Rhizobium TaxID=379 RepID=UPI0007158D31|nr:MULTISPECIES: glyoxylate/hydroxypyruvate reductase A [Rhizobium]KQZ47743.1 glyoxylate/hydroxypyruvate reductase A [Rhizobium sp. Root149]
MTPPIAFVTRMPGDEEKQWLNVLQQSMPAEHILSFRDLTQEERRLAEIAIVANPDPCDVAALPGISWIHSLWAGVERLVAELGAAAPPIVRLIDPELSRVMAEAVLAWTYYLQREMPAYRKQQVDCRWEPRSYRHPGEMTVGLLGLGVLGKAAAGRLMDAGFQVQSWSGSAATLPGAVHFTGEDGLNTVLSTSDIIVCLLPLTTETRGLLNKHRLGLMPNGASLINFARGAIVDADDLTELLNSRHLDHAVLDVFTQEPLDENSPLWRHPDITVLPHISAPTNAVTAAKIVAQNIETWRSTGKLPATIDRKRGY